MTGRERILLALDGTPTDFVARTPILMRFGAEYIGSNYGAFASDFNTLVEATYRTAVDFGYDQVSVISDPYRETQGFGAEIQFVVDGVPRCVKHPLEDDPDLDRLLKPDPLRSERMLDRVRAVEKLKRIASDYSILGWVEGPAAEATDLRNAEPFLVDLIDDEDYACELMDIATETAINFARAQVEAGADMIGMGDAIASQVGPAIYEELIQPREKRIVDAVKAMGRQVKIHICGDITALLPGLADVAPQVLDCDHMVSLEKARRIMPAGTILTGNLDPANDVLFGDPKSIRRKLERAYREAGNPYFVNAGCEIPSGTPAENLRALCEPLAYRP
ncbi:MAG: uroporphyrinogen decarboxylase family protein [Planctomycetota bacterium]|jgi:MtaA/CmuA family methyltransferase|nr:uroporphyrinogen decarboxylase family protein [Planctomycetota bacterium]